ncbi:MAG TPA: hypothetical protein VE673_03620 [Pseudonocardiaceae bacterium]|nr:hypothetical protein [Pseudonocardiaceae bacterium]
MRRETVYVRVGWICLVVVGVAILAFGVIAATVPMSGDEPLMRADGVASIGVGLFGTRHRQCRAGFFWYLERLIQAVRCVECGDDLLAERAELGYQYCTKKQCQLKHHEGLTITAIGVNKSADTFIVGDPEEIRRRAEAGEFAKKDSGLGINYRAPGTETPPRRREPPALPNRTVPTRRPWTAEQEKVVRLYHGMGMTPRQIAERARENTPRLGITENLAVKIICSLPVK